MLYIRSKLEHVYAVEILEQLEYLPAALAMGEPFRQTLELTRAKCWMSESR